MTSENQPITRHEFREEIQSLKDDLREEIQVQLRHYATKSDLAELETRLIKWMIGMMLGSVTMATTLAIFIQRLID